MFCISTVRKRRIAPHMHVKHVRHLTPHRHTRDAATTALNHCSVDTCTFESLPPCANTLASAFVCVCVWVPDRMCIAKSCVRRRIRKSVGGLCSGVSYECVCVCNARSSLGSVVLASIARTHRNTGRGAPQRKGSQLSRHIKSWYQRKIHAFPTEPRSRNTRNGASVRSVSVVLVKYNTVQCLCFLQRAQRYSVCVCVIARVPVRANISKNTHPTNYKETHTHTHEQGLSQVPFDRRGFTYRQRNPTDTDLCTFCLRQLNSLVSSKYARTRVTALRTGSPATARCEKVHRQSMHPVSRVCATESSAEHAFAYANAVSGASRLGFVRISHGLQKVATWI